MQWVFPHSRCDGPRPWYAELHLDACFFRPSTTTSPPNTRGEHAIIVLTKPCVCVCESTEIPRRSLKAVSSPYLLRTQGLLCSCLPRYLVLSPTTSQPVWSASCACPSDPSQAETDQILVISGSRGHHANPFRRSSSAVVSQIEFFPSAKILYLLPTCLPPVGTSYRS